MNHSAVRVKGTVTMTQIVKVYSTAAATIVMLAHLEWIAALVDAQQTAIAPTAPYSPRQPPDSPRQPQQPQTAPGSPRSPRQTLRREMR